MPLMPRGTVGRFRPEALLHPGSVAVIGADTQEGAQITANLLIGGFHGTLETVSDVDALAATPDLAIVCAQADQLDPIFTALGRRGTHAAVVPGPGADLRELAERTGVRALGPGSFGVAVPGIGLNATAAHLPPPAGRIALVSQSAALCRAVIDWAAPNGVGFSHIVGIGGNGDIGFGLVLDWMSRDSATGAILLDIRRIKDPRVFLSAARAAARLRPVVAIRAGSRLSDPSGDADATFEAALRRCGVLCVSTLADLLAAAETLTRARPVRTEALAIVTNATGPARLAADAALRDGIPLAGAVAHADPRDPARLAALALERAAMPGIGGVLAVHAPTGAGDDIALQAIIDAAKTIKVPLLVCAMGETTGAEHRRRLAAAGLPAFAEPEQAVRGFFHLVQDRRNRAAARELPPSTVLSITPDRALVRRRFAQARAAGQTLLLQDAALDLLAAYGVPTAPGRIAASAEDAVDAAALLGYPVVLKRRRLALPEPSARSALALDLRDAAQLREGAAALERRQTARPAESLGYLVQRQAGRARELLIRVGEDAVFGPTIAFGAGGSAAEILHDVALDLPPLNLTLAHALIGRARVAATLGQLHDFPAANREAIAETLVRISQLVVDFPEIAALDLNPLFVDAHGVLAADAWIRLRDPGAAPARLGISPYPAELMSHVEARGERFTLRPIRPEDAEQHGAFFKRLSPQDIRYRFFSAMREMSAEQMARLTQVDYEREMAFIVVRDATGDTVGVARLVGEVGRGEGEFAIIVEPDMKGRGLARALMHKLIAWGRAQGMTDIVGQVLADNQPMLGFVRGLGFTVRRVPGESDVVEARLGLAA